MVLTDVNRTLAHEATILATLLVVSRLVDRFRRRRCSVLLDSADVCFVYTC